MLYAVLGYLGAGATEMAAEAQAECLLALEETDAVTTATRAQILSTFTAALGYSADGDYSPRSGRSTAPGSPRAPRPGTWPGPDGPPPTRG